MGAGRGVYHRRFRGGIRRGTVRPAGCAGKRGDADHHRAEGRDRERQGTGHDGGRGVLHPRPHLRPVRRADFLRRGQLHGQERVGRMGEQRHREGGL